MSRRWLLSITVILLFTALVVAGIVLWVQSLRDGGKEGLEEKQAEKTPAERLIGKWELVKTEGFFLPGTTVEFTEDGAVWAKIKALGMAYAAKGLYTVKGSQVTILLKKDDKKEAGPEKTSKLTILKLTATALEVKVVKDVKSEGETQEYRRLK
jgi:uncharacterized protein (TIGR03066 family)